MDKSIKIKTLELKKINQFSNQNNNSKGVYNAIWKFDDFINSLKFTHREPLNYNIFQEETNLFNQEIKKYPEFNTDYYQRLVNDEKTKKVILFLIKELKGSIETPDNYLITFPTSLIFSLYTSEAKSVVEYETYVKEEIKKNEEEIKRNRLKGIEDVDFYMEDIGVFLDKKNIILPNINILLVVDGQHRLAGLLAVYYSILSEIEGDRHKINRKLIEFAAKNIEKENFIEKEKLKEIIEKFEFNCTILIDFDIWEQGKVFADVNFNQKPVNKSLYYDIFGSYPDTENNDLFLAHQWVVYLNSEINSPYTSQQSPFYQKVKMLGNGEGYISQAFLVESIFPLLRKNGIWNVFLDEYISNKVISDKPIIFIETYFNVIKNLFLDYWPTPTHKPSAYKNILFKTTGLAALFMLIKDIYPRVEDFVYKDNIDELTKKIKSEFHDSEGKLKIDPEKLFSKDGEFSKGAGKGLQVRLYKRIAFDLQYRKTID
jgi:hypothetical protein